MRGADHPKSELKAHLQDQQHYLMTNIMELRSSAANRNNGSITTEGAPRIDYRRSFSSHGHGGGGGGKRRGISGVESMLLLICLTASLLLLPVILPPLPPPPFMLLLVPICIFALLMLLAFMPFSSSSSKIPEASNSNNFTYL